MKYKLFIDDIRNPSDFYDEDFLVARSLAEVKMLIFKFSYFPEFISFDCDMGDGAPDGMAIASWLVNMDLEQSQIGDTFRFSDNFQFKVHSNNQISGSRLEKYLDSYLNHRNSNHSVKKEIAKLAFSS